jgi:hypothetical protein
MLTDAMIFSVAKNKFANPHEPRLGQAKFFHPTKQKNTFSPEITHDPFWGFWEKRLGILGKKQLRDSHCQVHYKM